MKLPKTLQKYAAKIDDFEDQTHEYNGYWVYLVAGWKNSNDPMGTCHAIHEDTVSACATLVRMAIPCDCSDCIDSLRKQGIK